MSYSENKTTGSLTIGVADAQRMLMSISSSPVKAVERFYSTNHVVRATTEGDGPFFIKCHAAPWYYHKPANTRIVVQREIAVAAMLREKGIPQGYDLWVEASPEDTERPALIMSELAGVPVPSALKSHPQEQTSILQALARFLSRLHALTFTRHGYIEFAEDPDLPFSLEPREHEWWDSHPCHSHERFIEFADKVMQHKERLLAAPVAGMLRDFFTRIPKDFLSGYESPRFVINNYHPEHVHLSHEPTGWKAAGLLDLEAVSAGNPIFDLVSNEIQITPAMGGLSWRSLFYDSYGGWPSFEAYKMTLLSLLLLRLDEKPNPIVPDPEWLMQALPDLIHASGYGSFQWYPE